MNKQNDVSHLINNAFHGRYRLIKNLGSGGMGSVYLIESNDEFRLQRALKIIIKTDNTLNTKNEIEALKELNHPNIPKIIEAVDDGHFVFIIQEYIKGKSLSQLINENGSIPEDYALVWMYDIATILSYMHHKKIIHSDIKPNNIMITDIGEVKLIDFGISKNLDEIENSEADIFGSKYYTPPERYSHSPVDMRTDIYGFGTTCYHMLTGIQPIQITKTSNKKLMNVMIQNLEPLQSSGLKKIIAKCIELNPDNRYQSFDEIRLYLNGIDQYNKSLVENERKQKLKLTGNVLLLFIGIIITVFGFNLWIKERQDHYNSLISKAQEAYDTNNLDQTKFYYNEAINFKPNELAAYKELFEMDIQLGEYQEVIDGIKELFNKVPTARENTDLLYLLGNSYYELNDFSSAEPYLQEAVINNPDLNNLLLLGMNYSEQGKYDQAQEVINELNALEATDVSQLLSGEIFRKQNNTQKAEETFRNIINSPTEIDLKKLAFISLSKIYKDNSNYLEQVTLLEQAKDVDGLQNDYKISEMLANAYYTAGENDQGIEFYAKADAQFNDLIGQGFKQANIYRNIAVIDEKLGKFDEAEAILNQMEESFPSDATANIQKAILILEREGAKNESDRDYSNFITEYNKALEKDDGSHAKEIQTLKERYNELIAKGWL